MADMSQPESPLQVPAQAGLCAVAVLFADVAASTKLYETLGDVVAKAMVDECIALMRSTIEQYGGRVIKTIGDEVMCVLPDANGACLTASDIQLRISALPAVAMQKRAVRIGFHYGSVIEQDQDVFGDTVNLAARMVGLAGAGQIITTRESADRLSSELRSSSRVIAALSIKGKDDKVEVSEIVWQAGEELTMITGSVFAAPAIASLHLKCGSTELLLQQANASVLLGRDLQCQIVVADKMASRQHARIERRHDKFFLIDQSVNGTFVSLDGKPEILLRREELMLRVKGRVAFGRSLSESSDATVEFLVS